MIHVIYILAVICLDPTLGASYSGFISLTLRTLMQLAYSHSQSCDHEGTKCMPISLFLQFLLLSNDKILDVTDVNTIFMLVFE